MKFITAVGKNKTLYIEKEKVAAILSEPQIQRVTAADEKIGGISLYNGQLVVYHQLGVCRTERMCGIIVKTGGESLTGIIADYPSQESMEPDDLSLVMPGVWEINSD